MMGIEPLEQTARNAEIIENYQSGMSIVRLVAKYGISSARIYQILKAYGVKLDRKQK